MAARASGLLNLQPRSAALAGGLARAARAPLGAVPAAPAAAASGARRTIVHAEMTGTVVQVGKQNHWTAFMYGRERQLLEYAMSNVEEGDTAGVLSAMDDFWAHHFGMKGTGSWSMRKDVLDATLREKRPAFCVELGTYCGYSALRIASSLPEHGKLVSMEVDPLFSAIATKIIEHAGMQDKVRVLTGTVESRMQRLKDCLGAPRADFILCDHSKERFVPDLEELERAGVAGPGTTVMGDTTLYPGDDSPDSGKDLLSHFASSDKYRVAQHVGTEKSSGITVCEWHHMV